MPTMNTRKVTIWTLDNFQKISGYEMASIIVG